MVKLAVVFGLLAFAILPLTHYLYAPPGRFRITNAYVYPGAESDIDITVNHEAIAQQAPTGDGPLWKVTFDFICEHCREQEVHNIQLWNGNGDLSNPYPVYKSFHDGDILTISYIVRTKGSLKLPVLE